MSRRKYSAHAWRLKDKKSAPGIGSNKRPDFQELLSDVRLSVWVRPGADAREPSLHARLTDALERPAEVKRFGGLSLGESTMLVDEVRRWNGRDPTDSHLFGDEVKARFRPEFLNRVDEQIVFRPLSEEDARRILRPMLDAMSR